MAPRPDRRVARSVSRGGPQGSSRSRGSDLLIGVSAAAWTYLVFARGAFWRAEPTLEAADSPDRDATGRRHDVAVVAIVPARNEEELLPTTLELLARQASSGLVGIVVVDDASADDTAGVAEAADTGSVPVVVVRSAPLPDGWSGKVWALEQGRRTALAHWGADQVEPGPVAAGRGLGSAGRGLCSAGQGLRPAWLWLVDADIAVREGVLSRLLAEAESDERDLVSVMAKLRVEHPAERLLVPAFVYFFQLLYPFRWVCRPGARTAAAAGGCVLVRTAALERIGGFSSIAGRRIDDVALARTIRRGGRPGGPRPGRLWLGFDPGVESRRPYDGLRTIWDMVARNAFTQLGESRALLAVTVAGLGISFVAPPLLAGTRCVALLRAGRLDGAAAAVRSLGFGALAAATSAAATLSYVPTVKRCGLPRRWAITLPVASLLYAGMTVDSARRSRAGLSWRGRRLESPPPNP